MNQLTEQQLSDIQFLFKNFTHPTLEKDLISINAFKKAELGMGILRLEFVMPFAWNTGFEALKQATESKLREIYGPSIPHMLGAKDQRPFSPDNKHINPIEVFGLQSNSIGYLMPEDNATIWRGPMASSALSQLLNETWWNELDYLVIDMPPGTGDIQLTLSQQIPVTGAIVVTTPQDIALIDAIKGISMFKQVSVPVLGVVENMSTHICSNCGHHEDIFGTGGAEKIANKYGTQVLGKLPLHIRLRQDLDAGTPTVAADPNNEISQAYLELAAKVASQLYWQGCVIPSEIMIREVK